MELKWKTCLKAGVTVVFIYIFIRYWEILSGFLGLAFGAVKPLLLGCVIAYIVNILMTFYEKHLKKLVASARFPLLRRAACMLLAYLSIILIAILIVCMIMPELINCFKLLIREMPGVLQDTYIWLEENFDISSYSSLDFEAYLMELKNFDWQSILQRAGTSIISGLGDAMGIAAGIVSATVSWTVTIIVAIIFSIYILLGKDRITRQVKAIINRYAKNETAARIFYVADVFNSTFHSFIVGQCTEAVILGCLCMLGMFILRLPYAAMIGCLIGFTALIPIAGAYIGAAVGAFMIFTIAPFKALVFLIFLVILQQTEGNLIYPKVVGSSIGLPGIWVLAAVAIGGGMFGILGMLIGVPFAATIYQLLKNDVYKTQSKA